MGRIGRLMDLPTCELHRLREIADLVTSVRLSRTRKQKLALALKNKGYIPKLLQLFQVCESAKNTEGLHLLFDIVRGILYLDKAILFEVMFSDECILGVLGCLEYDPCLAQPGRHRECLAKTAKLQEVIPVRDPELRKKIRQASGAQYIQAIIMPNPSDFEEGFLSTLDSFISSRKEEILHGLQKDEAFLPEVFEQLTNEATGGEQRCELIKFFKEFCAFSFTLPEKRDEFLQTLGKLGFLPTLEMLMGMDELQVRSAATDILSYLVEFSPTTVQEFVMQEARQSEKDTQLITEVIKQMICTPSPEFGGDNQLMEIFCALIDPEKMLATASNLEVFEFLDIFYDRYIHVLTAPLLADTSDEWHEIDNYRTAEILASVLELLSFCVERHQYHMKIYMIKKDLLRRALVLMKSKHKFLALSALRFMRKIIGLKDELYNHYITLGKLLEPVVNAVLDNRNRCNLLKSASMELFEFIRKENIQLLIVHIVENFSDVLESVTDIHTFQGLKTKYEQGKDQQKEKLNSVPSILLGETFVKEAAASQVDEVLQFSEREEKAAPVSPPSSRGSCPTCTTLTAALAAPKRGIFEIFGFPGDEDEETPPKKRARLDS
ncbi:serine/threonine-protein phosphatase 4 regulatory subunit 3B-like [Prinia subflava]|uniref:serine/threonine-protein phosphatase 4 regulatory subunit 3B-like n=1 Tax=Prinia subflava TaxID=208062 RepID=UPI002FE3CAF6